VPKRVLFAALIVALGQAGCGGPTPAQRAMSLTRQHREAEAVALLRATLEQRPGDVESRRLLVRLLAFTGDLEGAKVEVRALEAKLPPGDPTPWVELGHALELAHRFDEALAAYDEAARVAPASPAGPREAGMRAARWGEPEAARERLEEAVRRGARDAETWHALGLVRLKLNEVDAAEQAYRAGAAADANAVENLLGLASVAWVRGDPRGALDAYDAILARRPRSADASLGRAYALAKLGRRDEAARELEHAEELGAAKTFVDKQRAALRAAPATP
jgi:cytochrome c-type biogenesis protein CcmH/NrfG